MREYFQEEVFPLAWQYGLSGHQFWHEDPSLLQTAEKAYYRDAYFKAHLYGYYNFIAVSDALHNALRKKGQKTVQYPKEPYDPIKKRKKKKSKTQIEQQFRASMVKEFYRLQDAKNKK